MTTVTNILALVTLFLVVGACTKDEGNDAHRAATSTSASDLSQDAKDSLDRVIDSYENIRAKLVRDELEGITASAETLERTADEAATLAPERFRAQLHALATAAKRLKETAPADGAVVRQTFGDASRSVVSLLSAEPSLRGGRYVFECPMAKGYKKWVQPSATASNPYMGGQMPTCGEQGEW